MKVLILYGTTHGCTKKCTDKLASNLQIFRPSSFDIDIVSAKGNANFNITEYETVIIGGSIRLGKMNKAVSNFCKKNLDTLVLKKTGLFVCCMSEQDKAEMYMTGSFPRKLLESAIAKGYFGGELIFEEMADIEKSLLKTVIGHEKSVSMIDEEGIEAFAEKIIKSR